MQLVSRDVLEELVNSGMTFEGEDSLERQPTFKDVLKEERKFIDNGKKLSYPDFHIPGKPRIVDEIHYAYEMMLETYLKKNHKFIRYVDNGSSRTVFALAGGKCMKLANSKRGVAQNKQEVLNSQNRYTCFPVLYDFDDRDFSMILVECCSQIKDDEKANDFKKAFGDSQLIHLIAALHDIVNISNCDIDEAIKMLQHAEDYGTYAYGEESDEYGSSFKMRKSFCMMIRDSRAPQYEVLRQLIKFYADHGRNDDQCLLVDLEGIFNWGLAARDGKLVPIVIDSGFSEEVREKFY